MREKSMRENKKRGRKERQTNTKIRERKKERHTEREEDV